MINYISMVSNLSWSYLLSVIISSRIHQYLTTSSESVYSVLLRKRRHLSINYKLGFRLEFCPGECPNARHFSNCLLFWWILWVDRKLFRKLKQLWNFDIKSWKGMTRCSLMRKSCSIRFLWGNKTTHKVRDGIIEALATQTEYR